MLVRAQIHVQGWAVIGSSKTTSPLGSTRLLLPTSPASHLVKSSSHHSQHISLPKFQTLPIESPVKQSNVVLRDRRPLQRPRPTSSSSSTYNPPSQKHLKNVGGYAEDAPGSPSHNPPTNTLRGMQQYGLYRRRRGRETDLDAEGDRADSFQVYA